MARLQMTSEEMSAYAVFIVRQIFIDADPSDLDAQLMQRNGWLIDKYAEMDMEQICMILTR